LNKRGFTLVEVLMAGSLLVTTLACFGYLLKISLNHVKKIETKAQILYQARGGMERVRQVPFADLPAAASAETAITQVAVDLYLIKVGALYTLRSQYQ
jgi:hypothetical protein